MKIKEVTKLKMLIFLVVCVILIKNGSTLPEYHQNDYDVKFERGEILWYNQSLIRNLTFTFPFYNRTHRLFDISGYLLHDMDSTDLVIELQMYKFLSNEYRHFPLRVAANVCEEYKRNNFNAREIVRNISNVYDCPVKKGYYYIHRLNMDYSRSPPFIPRGRYKCHSNWYYNQKFILEADAYFEIKDKPMKWWK